MIAESHKGQSTEEGAVETLWALTSLRLGMFSPEKENKNATFQIHSLLCQGPRHLISVLIFLIPWHHPDWWPPLLELNPATGRIQMMYLDDTPLLAVSSLALFCPSSPSFPETLGWNSSFEKAFDINMKFILFWALLNLTGEYLPHSSLYLPKRNPGGITKDR